MDFSSRQVNAEIKRKVWPVLRAEGFDKFNARNGWKHQADSISVVNFQSFSSHLASGLDCTTFSFAVNLGVYYLCVHDTPWASEWPILYPTRPTDPPESACHARLHLEKRISQCEYSRSDIWYIRPDGSNLNEVIDDAILSLVDVGLPWLVQFGGLRHALGQYQLPRRARGPEYVCALGTQKGAAEGSAITFALKDFEAAKSLWRSVVDSKYYSLSGHA